MLRENENKVRSVNRAVLHTRTGTFLFGIKVAETFLSRFRGLMLTRPLHPDQGFLITGCPSVHTAFMRYAIDVIYLDRTGRVLKCVSGLKPWRGSFSHTGIDGGGKRNVRAAHTLELAAGSIERLNVEPGNWLEHPLWDAAEAVEGQERATRHTDSLEISATQELNKVIRRNTNSISSIRPRGAAMIEFVVVGPIITLLGLAILQYGMLFFAKNQINHAAFMAARAGAMGHASLASAQIAYERALIPLYGGGINNDDLKESLKKAQDDIAANVRIELLNPTKESFDDWNDPALRNTVGGGKRVIPNSGLVFKSPDEVKPNSGQNIQDANLIKLRITHGYEPKVPLLKLIYTRFLKWLDTGSDSFYTQLVNQGRIPVVSHVTMQMQSDAIEPANPVSMPGHGNNGNPINPGDPPGVSTDPPNCLTIGCTVDNPPVTPADPGGGGSGGGGACEGVNCPSCPGSVPIPPTTLSADLLFPFDRSSINDLSPEGRAQLDKLIAAYKKEKIKSIKVVGHTDQIGSDQYNKDLSLARAKSVRDYLINNGFSGIQIDIEGRGASDPVKPLSDCAGKNDKELKACLQENRRVVVYWDTAE
jgi:outer membrane protein OmpA-like peptidoglycan-associated protein/uncharacterized membrane protein (UPF0127 family)